MDSITMNERKHIVVVAAIIVRDGRIFATQRGYGDWKDWWEFPGGKVEPGESPEDALKREIREELSTNDRTTHIKNDAVIRICDAKLTCSELTEEISICIYEERTR